MSRRLQVIVLEVELAPLTLRVRQGEELPALEHGPTVGAVAWEQSRDLGGWEGQSGDQHAHRARLPWSADGGYVTDDAFDVGANGYRWAAAPAVSASGMRSLIALELLWVGPDDSTGVLFRLHDGADPYWWTGSAWAVATTDAHWSTAEDVQAHFSAWSAGLEARTVQVVARLSTTSSWWTPSFFGYRVALGLAELGDVDDALMRTALPVLRTLEATGIMRWTSAGEDAIDVPPADTVYPAIDVDAVYDQTADPLEAAPVAGAWAAGTWTPTDPLTEAHVYWLEFRYRPDVVVQRHRAAAQLERLPAVYLEATSAPERWTGDGELEVRDLYADPPVSVALVAPETHELALQVRVVAEYWRDVDQVARALRRVLGADGAILVSPVSGRLVELRWVDALAETGALLAQGVSEARGSLALTFESQRAHNLTDRTHVAELALSVDASTRTTRRSP